VRHHFNLLLDGGSISGELPAQTRAEWQLGQSDAVGEHRRLLRCCGVP
jgi:hypothetical protein